MKKSPEEYLEEIHRMVGRSSHGNYEDNAKCAMSGICSLKEQIQELQSEVDGLRHWEQSVEHHLRMVPWYGLHEDLLANLKIHLGLPIDDEDY